jgi:uncharacterized protein (DUF2336 family)
MVNRISPSILADLRRFAGIVGSMAMSLTQLEMLARERLPGKRHELLRALSDAFFDSAHRLSAKERALFDDIVERVLDDVEPLARQELSERLATYPCAPHRVVVRLADDVIAVAGPVLTYSPVLEDDDLAPLARQKSQPHLLAISRREQLSERITDILVERGDALVLDAVVENLGARFSAPGAAALADKAKARKTLWQRLADRTDLVAHIAERMTPALAESMAAETARRGVGLAAAQSQTLLQEMRDTLAARLDAAAARARPLDELADQIAAGSLRFGEAVIELADADRVSDIAILVGARAGVDCHGFVRDLLAPDEKPLMTTCRAAWLELESFSALLRMRRRRRPFGTADVGRLLRAYQAMPAPHDADAPATETESH